MVSRSYNMKLSNHKLFRDLSASFTQNPSGKLLNLLELKDDVLYVWNSIENCLASLNLKHLEENEEETHYQKLHFQTPPQFAVERVGASACGTRVCAWGARGACVAELPTRWGRGGLFDGGSASVLCKSFSLDERFLYAQGEVRQVHWHPSVLSHLWLLVSDNTIRLYNIALKSGPKLLKIFTTGPKPSGLLASVPILDSLGDTAVDFTTTPEADSLLILRGNGDVYMLDCDLESKPLRHKLTGPLAMYPPADDNYGSESCSITALSNGKGMPPLVVVATCSASLYHCLLLPNAAETDAASHALYVMEAVELDVPSSNDREMHYNYPVHLYACNHNTYACMHAGGVHTVTLPVLNDLKDYALADEAQAEAALAALAARRGAARHVLSAARPPLGLRAAPPPRAALLLLCSGALLLRTLEPYGLEEQLYNEVQLNNPALEQDDINKILKERQKLSFTQIIQEILERDASQPILDISSKEEPTPKESLELLAQATLVLREQYMARQQRAADAVGRKLAALRHMSQQHDAWFKDLKKEIEQVEAKSMALQKKSLIAQKHQDDIKDRWSSVARRLRAAAPATAAERTLLGELQRQQRCGQQLAEQIRQLKLHAQAKTIQMNNFHEEYKRKDLALGKSHKDTISSILKQHTSQISATIEEIKELKEQLNIV